MFTKPGIALNIPIDLLHYTLEKKANGFPTAEAPPEPGGARSPEHRAGSLPSLGWDQL